jgi:hypothetical protein
MTRTWRAPGDALADPIADRESTALKLLEASARHSFDPMREIDWDAPLAEDMLFIPERLVSAYGTPGWERMSRAQRIDLSRREVASMASVGIWFELILLRMLSRYLYGKDPTTRHVAYALTEIADECRHSIMFARLIDKLEAPAYGPGRQAMFLGRLMATISTGPEMFAATLIAEEILDSMQRDTMRDETVQPLIRAVNRIHVVEEARHVRYAREELVRQARRASGAQLARARLATARAAHVIGTRLVHPRVYSDAGLDPARTRAEIAAGPHRRQVLTRASGRLVSFFDEVGLMGGPGLRLWRSAGLID